MQLTLQDIEAARGRIGGGVAVTPCPESIPLSEITGMRVYCKLEYLQRTGSFKERGARNALLLLSDDKKQRGVIAASAGNHASALAYHGMLLEIPVTVVMPRFAPLIKVTNCRKLQANVVLDGETFAEARHKADEIAAQDGLTYIHGFDDPAIIAGAGTLGLEVLEQMPDVDAMVLPLGGAGLAAGVALAVKSKRPEVQIIGVEAERTASYSAAVAAGKPIDIHCQPTLADGLAVGRVGKFAFEIARPRLDHVVNVNEQQLALAILRLLKLEKSVVEGAGAAPLAACLANKLPELAGKCVVLLLCGGNIDPVILQRVIENGLVADGRLCRFTATISDRPGGLAKLAHTIAAAGASIKDVSHDRAFSGADVAAVNVLCTVETVDRGHVERLEAALRQVGIRVQWPTNPD